MSIAKKYKKQLKGVVNGTHKSTSSSDAKKPQRKRTWNVKVGDLVEVSDNDRAVVIEDNGDGFFLLLGPGGRRWLKATKIKKIQKGEFPK